MEIELDPEIGIRFELEELLELELELELELVEENVLSLLFILFLFDDRLFLRLSFHVLSKSLLAERTVFLLYFLELVVEEALFDILPIKTISDELSDTSSSSSNLGSSSFSSLSSSTNLGSSSFSSLSSLSNILSSSFSSSESTTVSPS